jgi:uncharacterized cupredoxin-like copper-binding protein
MRAGLALIAVVSLAAGGCGEERGQATRTVPERVGTVPAIDPRTVAVATVSLVDYALQAGQPRVGRAGIVAFEVTNDGLSDHALAVDAPAGQVRTRTLRPGQRTVLTVRLPAGTYKWYCPLADHEQRGMTGRVRVAE